MTVSPSKLGSAATGANIGTSLKEHGIQWGGRVTYSTDVLPRRRGRAGREEAMPTLGFLLFANAVPPRTHRKIDDLSTKGW
jgi:hypothetical protein